MPQQKMPQGLEPVVRRAIGSRVMLRTNLWTEKGLAKGALGTVKDILFKAEESPPADMPLAVMVKYDNCFGPFWPATHHDACYLTFYPEW